MSAFPSAPYDGEIYSIGARSWTWSEAQQGWLLNYNGPTGPTGVTGPTGTPGVLLTSLTVDSFVGDGLTTIFNLSVTPQNPNNTLVNVDGLVQTININYTVIGAAVTFYFAPIANATIDVTTFLTGSPVTGPIGFTGPTGPYSSITGPTGAKSSNTVRTVSSNTTITSTDSVILCNGAITVTMPAADSNSGAIYFIKNIGSSIVAVTAVSGDNIDGQSTRNLAAQYSSTILISNGVTSWNVF